MSPVVRIVLGVALSASISLIGAGCKKSEKEAPAEASSQAPPAAVPSSPSPTTATGAPNPITEEDFEAEAQRSIKGDNLEAALDALEREIREK